MNILIGSLFLLDHKLKKMDSNTNCHLCKNELASEDVGICNWCAKDLDEKYTYCSGCHQNNNVCLCCEDFICYKCGISLVGQWFQHFFGKYAGFLCDGCKDHNYCQQCDVFSNKTHDMCDAEFLKLTFDHIVID